MITVSAVHLGERLALLSDGNTVPITRLLDRDGQETDEPAEAVALVAGEGALWFSCLVCDFEDAPLQ